MSPLLALAALVAAYTTTASAQSVVISRVRNLRHDFSLASRTTVKASAADAICLFCHTPHNAKPAAPLWNHKLSQGHSYHVYQSSTLKSVVSQPQAGDSSKLCLSCHNHEHWNEGY